MVVKFRRQSGAHSNRRRHASAITNLYPHRIMPGSQMNVRSQFTSSSSFNRMTIEIGSLNRGTFTGPSERSVRAPPAATDSVSNLFIRRQITPLLGRQVARTKDREKKRLASSSFQCNANRARVVYAMFILNSTMGGNHFQEALHVPTEVITT